MNEINQSFSKIKHNSSHLSLLSPSSPPSPSSQQNPPFSFSHPSSSIPILSILPPLPNQPSSISHPPYSLPTLPHILNPPSFSSNPTCCSHLASPLLFPSYSSPIFNERRTQMDRMIEIFQQNEKKIEEESKQLEKLRRELQIENQRKNKYEEIKLQNESKNLPPLNSAHSYFFFFLLFLLLLLFLYFLLIFFCFVFKLIFGLSLA